MRRGAALAGCAVALTGCSGDHARKVGGYGLELTLPRGWYGIAGPGQLQAADFTLGREVLGSFGRADVRRGHVHLVVWDYGPVVPFLSRSFGPTRRPLTLRREDLLAGGMEGFPANRVLARRDFRLNGEQLEAIADLGPEPMAPGQLARANSILAALQVRPPRVIQAHAGRLEYDGLGVRLAAGWHGRIEIPANRQTRLVLRASRGGTRLVLLELPRSFDFHSRPLRLPVSFGIRDLLRGVGPVGRRTFTANGRNLDVSVAFASRADLARANRLLATLTVAPRPWKFRSCDLTLRLPGTWTAGIRRRGDCYSVMTLRSAGLTVVLTDLRPGERAHGMTLRRAGRRVQVAVVPRTRAGEAEDVLKGLRVRPRR